MDVRDAMVMLAGAQHENPSHSRSSPQGMLEMIDAMILDGHSCGMAIHVLPRPLHLQHLQEEEGAQRQERGCPSAPVTVLQMFRDFRIHTHDKSY